MPLKIEVGTVVAGRYEILQPLTAGGMGSVYRARDLHFSQREVALKQMHEEDTGWDEETRALVDRKFTEEADILTGLSHPGIPQVMDHFDSDSDHFIVMELIRGDSLDRVLADYLSLTGRPVPLDLALDWGIQLCDILEYLHTLKPHPIIHRDVKPGNIILRLNTRTVVLVDFGLARGLKTDSMSVKTLVGTVGYAPVEQFQGRPEIRTDVYSLAATLHHLVSGQPPVPFAIPPLRQALREADAELEAVLARALSNEVEDRHPSAAALREDLERVRRRTVGQSDLPARSPRSTQAPATQPMPAPEAGPEAESDLPAAAVTVELRDEEPQAVRPSFRLTRWHLAALGALLLVAMAALAWSAGRQNRFFVAFRDPGQARQGWRLETAHSAEGGTLRANPGQRAALLFSRREAAGPPTEVQFTVRNRLGNPTWIAVLGVLGLQAADVPTRNVTRVQALGLRNLPAGGSSFPEPETVDLAVEPIELPADARDFAVRVTRSGGTVRLEVNGVAREFPERLLPKGSVTRLGLLVLAPRGRHPEEAELTGLQVEPK